VSRSFNDGSALCVPYRPVFEVREHLEIVEVPLTV
jgi:hypothetical protein